MKITTDIPANLGGKMISQLKKIDGAISYDGDYSVQVVFMLANGKTLRFCVSDTCDTMSIDQYRGLAICGSQENPMTDLGLTA